MAYEEEKKGPRGFSFAGVMDRIRSAFISGAPGVIVSAGMPNRASNNAVITYARRIHNDAAGLTRQSKSTRKGQVWRNDMGDLVLKKLEENFHPENFARMALMPSKWSNPLARVINDISILYDTPAKRKLLSTEAVQTSGSSPDDVGTPNLEQPDLANVLGLSGAEPKEETAFDRLQKAIDLDVYLAEVERLVRIHPCVWVRPFVRYASELKDENGAPILTSDGRPQPDPDTGKLEYILYTPEHADVVPDPSNRTRAIAWYYWSDEINEKGELQRCIHFFTEHSYFKLDSEWKVIREEPNMLGRLPVTAFRVGLPVNSYYLDGVGDDLYEVTLEVNVLRTIQNARFRDGGFKQLMITGASPNDVPADQVMGGPTPIYGPTGSTAEVLDFQPDLAPMTAVIEQRVLESAAKYGVSPASYKSEGTPQSGFAKKLDQDKILKENKRIRKFFSEGEKDLYSLTAQLLEVSPVSAIGELDVSAEFVVDFGEPTFMEDPSKQPVIDAQNLKLNKTNIIEILRRENPDLSDVELMKIADRNKQINAAFLDSGELSLVDFLATSGGAAPNTEEGEPSDEEDPFADE